MSPFYPFIGGGGPPKGDNVTFFTVFYIGASRRSTANQIGKEENLERKRRRTKKVNKGKKSVRQASMEMGTFGAG